jgi:hypothetical protein
MSGHDGSCIALWSANGTYSRMGRWTVRSKAAQPPSGFCIASSQRIPRSAAARLAAPPTRSKAIATIAVSSQSG